MTETRPTPDTEILVSECMKLINSNHAMAMQRTLLEMLANKPNSSIILSLPRRPNKASTLKMIEKMLDNLEEGIPIDNAENILKCRLNYIYGDKAMTTHNGIFSK